MNPKAQERSILFLFLLQQNIIINDIWFPGGGNYAPWNDGLFPLNISAWSYSAVFFF